jgi:hypothetical protein
MSPVDVDTQEGNVVISLSLRGELYIVADAVQVMAEVIQLFPSLGPHNECRQRI